MMRVDSPVLLSADRFTSLAKTPWAGLTIGNKFKELCVPKYKGQKIGESWEFSCDPSFPSLLPDGKTSLIDFVAAHPEKVLSPGLARRQTEPSCEILVKFLNAAEPLSLQVHPE